MTLTMRGCAYWESPLQAVLQVNALCVQVSQAQSVLDAAKSECSRVSSLADFERSPYILPAAEKTRNCVTPPFAVH